MRLVKKKHGFLSGNPTQKKKTKNFSRGAQRQTLPKFAKVTK
jgi:hypothetical protein